MLRSRRLLGGQERFKFPEYVYSPTGGWWVNRPEWKRNTVFALMGLGSAIAGLFYVSAVGGFFLPWPL
jgi:hypothetical protein